MVKVIVAGDRNCSDYDLVAEAIECGLKELEIKMTELVSGHARGVDQTAEEWARRNDVNIVTFEPDWKDVTAPGAIVKERYNQWTKKNEKYNANAGFARNEEMAKYAGKKGALIAVDFNTPGTNSMIKLAKQYGLKVYQHKPQPMQPTDFTYQF